MSTNNTTSISTSSMKHDADQAGGEKEIVYSSDGGDPIKVLFPPKVQFDYSSVTGDSSKTNTNTNTNDDAIIVHDTISSEQAFEVFAGKLFYPNASSVTNNNKVSSYTIKKDESPLQKLSRIQAELNELKSYIDTDNSSTVVNNTAVATAGSTTTSSTINESFVNQIQSLQNLWGVLSDANAKQQETLASTIDAAVDGLSSTSTLHMSKDTSVSTQIPSKSSLSTTSVLEERIKRLELAIGAAGAGPISTTAATTTITSSSSTSSIVERIQKLEKLNINYNEKQSDMIQKRAKVIRQDLEAAAKARNKLMSLGGSSGGTSNSSSGAGNTGAGSGNANNNNIADDAKVISALYDQLQSLSGMTEHLPVLAERVQSLAINHRNVSTWEERLHTSEQIITSIQQQLSSIDTNINVLHTSIQNNTNQMKTNIDSLDTRIMKL